MAASNSQKNFQRSNTVMDSCKGLDTCWPDVPMDMFLLPQTTNSYIQQGMLNDLELELVDLHTEHQDFHDWSVSNILQSPSFGNYAVDGYYPMSYPAPATPTPTSTMEPFHHLAYPTQYMSADTNCMSYPDLSYNNVSSHNFNFNRSDDTNDSDSDSDATAFTLTPNSPIPEMMDTKPKSKSKSKPRMRKPKEPKPLKTFVCTFGGCMKVFSRQFNLDQHSKTHSNERPFVCVHEDCKKAFIRRADLVRHDRTHSGDTPFKCKFQDCNEMFSRTEARQRHHAKAHQELYQKSLEHMKKLERSPKTSTC
ncbi:hypothetical protein BGZ80_000147 [Entomortierella chlamydospora]|uniref:C2H2-type domain-containing protein n=1 Tax=Entomortierella chlamydospora TaxID=101097 RepID=A0A9P6MTH5_9FUNG|nr:hypothetical protein BGZ79_010679 [Entomortierella chlamydospora]KAG0012182.1 hypothetical protein BGZ80_000147 [Entomortierella chlamydospora]